jgi:hypothetical protein
MFLSEMKASGKYDSEIQFYAEALTRFNFETAKKKNKSFRYFIEKYSLVE